LVTFFKLVPLEPFWPPLGFFFFFFVVDLEDSSNRSKPPSTNDGFKDPEKSSSKSTIKKKKKPRGGQIGSKGTNLKKVTNPDHIEKLEINSCKNCSHNLRNI